MTLPEDESIAPPAEGEAALPDVSDAAAPENQRSLIEDVEALIDDGKTYLEAEIAYQKTRAAHVAEEAKGALIFGAVAAGLAFLALIGLTVGLIISLTPILTAWGASALVVALLVIGALVAARMAAGRWSGLMSVIDAGRDSGSERKP